MAQNTGKSDFLHYFNSFNRNWGGGAIALFYRKTLQACFWKIRI